MMIDKKILEHPSYYIQIFNKYILILFILGILQFIWGVSIYILNQKNSLLFYLIYKKFIQSNLKWEDIYTIINIYCMYSILHSLYIILASLMSFFLTSKNWFYSMIYFNFFPLVGFLFGLIQIPVSIFIFKKMNHTKWKQFFKHYDTFSSMKN